MPIISIVALVLAISLIIFIYRKMNYEKGEVVPLNKKTSDFDKNDIKKAVKDFESKNGTKLKDFSVKEVVTLLHKDTQGKIAELNTKLDSRIEWGQKTLSKHEIIIQKITDQLEHIVTELPEKGFCEKVTNALKLDKQITLGDQVEKLWHDRRWLKGIFYALIAVSSGIVLNIIIQVTT